jgi:eukaryotic-like serine/threonine-protein kinase
MNFNVNLRCEKLLAEGGFGVVYLAKVLNPKSLYFSKTVIVKQVKKPQLSDKDIDLFYQEVALMEYFKNIRNTAKIIGYSCYPYCIVMKYYENGNLSNWFANTSQRVKIHVLSFLWDIASGLMDMHAKGVVHLDLKPENVLMDSDVNRPVCVLSDFGISQVVSSDILTVKQFKATEIRALSVSYAAPERLINWRQRHLAQNRDEVLSWDVYSLGIVMFQFLTGKLKIYY